MKKIQLYLTLIALVASMACIFKKERPTLYIIGDSTVKNGSGLGKDGMFGWGSVIPDYFDTTRIHIENHAIGGRSSRTFLTEGRWDKIMAKLKKGDYVIMQFGHNDAGAVNDTSRARGTIRGIGDETEEIDNMLTKKHEIVHTYGWYIKKYITDTKSKGATAIVCSPVPRNVWKNGKTEQSTTSYTKWAAECASLEGADFINLNERVALKYDANWTEEKLKTAYFTPKDHTHTNYEGAKVNAETVVEGLKDLKGNKLKKFLK